MAVIETNKLNVCKQKIDEIKVIFEDGSTKSILPHSISFMSIEKNFFYNFLPIFCIKAHVDYSLYKKINENKCKFKLDIYKFFIKSNSENFDKKTIVTKNFINDIFINTNAGDTSPDLYENLNTNRDNEPNDFEKSQIEVELMLFQESAMNYDKLNNNIFATCNVSDAIIALASVTKQRSMVMSYPTNESIYSNIVIPNNLTFIGCIDFLQSVYGIYDTGFCLFSDFDALYLVDKNVKCNAYRRNEYRTININISDKTKDSGNIDGLYTDDKYKCYMINNANKPTIFIKDSAVNNIVPENVNAVNTTNSNSSGSSTEKVRIVDNKFDNSYSVAAYKYEKSMLTELEIDFTESDLDIFKVNREYNISFDMLTNNEAYKNSSGLYKLQSLQAVYIKSDDEIFKNVIRVKFVRV